MITKNPFFFRKLEVLSRDLCYEYTNISGERLVFSCYAEKYCKFYLTICKWKADAFLFLGSQLQHSTFSPEEIWNTQNGFDAICEAIHLLTNVSVWMSRVLHCVFA